MHLQQLLVSAHAVTLSRDKQVEIAAASLLDDIEREGRRVGKIIERKHQCHVGQVRKRCNGHNPLKILDGWESSAIKMHPLDFVEPKVLSLGVDGTPYRNCGDHYHREEISRYSVEARTRLLEAIRKLGL